MFKTAAASSLLLLATFSQPAAADARLAVLHLAPFADTLEGTAVNINANGAPLFENVKFKDFVDYTSLPAGQYTVDIIPVGATDPAISATIDLEDNKDFSAFAVGNGTTQPLGLMILDDSGNMPANSGDVAVRVVHAAPFAADLDNTQVSIRTAGGDVVNNLTAVPYGVSSGFFDIPAGEYDLKVASVDGSVNLIDPLPAELPAGAGVTIYAVGDVVNQPLGILAFPVGELMTRTPVDNRSNGLWEVMEGSGTGYHFMPMPAENRVVGTWFTYDSGGNPTFFTFDSCLDSVDDMGGYYCSTPGAFDGVTATTSLYASSGGGNNEDDVVVTTKVGEIDFEVLGCHDAIATVRLDGADPAVYSAQNLTSSFPCLDPQ